jgi:hypothetical protein
MIRQLGNVEKCGTFSFILCQETGGTALEFYDSTAREKVKRHFLISGTAEGNITTCCMEHIAHELQVW